MLASTEKFTDKKAEVMKIVNPAIRHGRDGRSRPYDGWYGDGA